MKANRASRRCARDDVAGAETVGAIILFGVFVATIAFLNVTAVPQAGLEAEELHYLDVLAALNGLQASAEAATIGGTGGTVSQSLILGPQQSAGSDFFSYFIATPAQAAGELMFNASYGSVTLSHTVDPSGSIVYDVGSATAGLPMGRLAFDPHPVFRNSGLVSLENGALVTTDGSTQTLRYAPPISLSQSGTTTYLTVKSRVLNGTSTSIGGTGPARASLATEATTLVSPGAPNAATVTLRIETAYGSAWGSYLNTTAITAGLSSGAGYTTTVSMGTGTSGLDVVTWTVTGTGLGNDLRLTSGLAILGVKLS